MSERSDLVERCRRKQWYESEEVAKYYGDQSGKYRYHCCICRLWHLTSTPVVEGLNRAQWRREELWQETMKKGKK